MTSYLSKLIDSPGYERLAAEKPETLCPYLYYNISSYVFTLANNGWFSWIKRARNPTDRRPAAITNPSLKKTNRKFINEVVVRCPNPETAVIAGIGPWQDDTLAIRILRADENCPCHHAPGQQTILEKTAADTALKYARLFPEILVRAMTPISPEEAIKRFDEHRPGTITPAEIINPCRYHKQPVPYDCRRLLPDNCCPHVFQQIYPLVLAVMYNADVDTVQTIHPPRHEGSMTVRIEKMPAAGTGLIKKLRDGADFIFSRLFHPLDRIDYSLTLNILDAEGQTARTMREGRRYAANLNSPDFLCPAAFHAVYPYLLLAAADSEIDWGGIRDGNRSPCPDCAGVIFSIEGISKNHQAL